MARKYTVVEIDGIKYELHGVKVEKQKVGKVPVRQFAGDDPFIDFVKCANASELRLVIADWKYGNGVRLQGMVRKSITGEGFSDEAMNKVYASLTTDECAQFHRDHAGLVGFCKERWAQMQNYDADEIDENHIWEEYASTHAAEIEIH